MKRDEVAWLYNDDPESFSVELQSLNADEFEDYELLAIESFPRLMNALQAELELLEAQYPEDDDVQYVLRVVENEGPWYAMVHKFDVGSHLGRRSTCAKLAALIKGCDMVLSDLVEEEVEGESHA